VKALPILVAAVLACAVLASRLARSRAAAAALVGWNPLFAIHFAGGGHNDALLAALVLGALLLATTGRRALAGAAWAGAILLKWIPVVFLVLRALEARATGRRVDHRGFAVAGLVLLGLATWRYGRTLGKALLDLETMASRPAHSCSANDIAIAKISLGRAAAIDVFTETPETGTLLLVDSVSGATIAGGIATAVDSKAEAPSEGHFVLRRDMLGNGLNRDLSTNSKDREEFMRRANEVAIILRAAGVSVAIEPPPPIDDGMDPGL